MKIYLHWEPHNKRYMADICDGRTKQLKYLGVLKSWEAYGQYLVFTLRSASPNPSFMTAKENVFVYDPDTRANFNDFRLRIGATGSSSTHLERRN